MAKVLIRVELKGTPSSSTYESLHSYMEGKGWSRSIVASSGESAPLPTAMYYGDYEKELSVLAKALATYISNNIWTRPWVFCMETDNMAWVEM